MKPPEELAKRLARQWDNADLREARLLQRDAWPVRLPIGKPDASDARDRPGAIRDHIQVWQGVSAGEVEWQTVRYRDLAEQVSVPVAWKINKPSEWVEATADSGLRREFQQFAKIIEKSDPQFHSFVIRQRHLVRNTPPEEVITAAHIATIIEPGMAGGAPLRALALEGIDSKFLERNRNLVTRLLDIRFDGAAGDMGLETFLDAAPQSEQWLLVVDLDGSLLPFRQIRIRDSELRETALPASHILIVENERCSHVLPEVKDGIAILGAGLNLAWMDAAWLSNREIAYWGDIDTWGLTMLARAREKQAGLTPLLMSPSVFNQFCATNAVAEPVPASVTIPSHLSVAEFELYQSLLQSARGRLEQEFLPARLVQEAILDWALP